MCALFYEYRLGIKKRVISFVYLFCPNTGTKFREPYHSNHVIPHRDTGWWKVWAWAKCGPRWFGSSWQRGIAESGSSQLSTHMIETPGDLVWDLPCVQQASCLKGGPLLWIWPLYLHMNQKSDDDDDFLCISMVQIQDSLLRGHFRPGDQHLNKLRDFSLFSSGGHLINQSRTVLAFLVWGWGEGGTQVSFLWSLTQIGPRV